VEPRLNTPEYRAAQGMTGYVILRSGYKLNQINAA